MLLKMWKWSEMHTVGTIWAHAFGTACATKPLSASFHVPPAAMLVAVASVIPCKQSRAFPAPSSDAAMGSPVLTLAGSVCQHVRFASVQIPPQK
jgi:hypothetical protein